MAVFWVFCYWKRNYITIPGKHMTFKCLNQFRCNVWQFILHSAKKSIAFQETILWSSFCDPGVDVDISWLRSFWCSSVLGFKASITFPTQDSSSSMSFDYNLLFRQCWKQNTNWNFCADTNYIQNYGMYLKGIKT